MPKITKANPFIIESLDFDGEQNHRFEGRFLSQILHLSGKESAYYYFRNRVELQNLMKLFGRSDYRYLHLSCHGGGGAIDTTLEIIPFAKLARIMNPYLDHKRLFVSACSVVNEDLAQKVIPSSECLSIIGPAKDIRFNEAAIVWASFYYLMFKDARRKMDREGLKRNLKKVAATFRIPLNYFSISEEYGFKGDRITTRGKIVRIYPKPK